MTNLQKLGQLPYRLMRKFADRHNNLHDYTLLHAGAWTIGLALMLCVSALAWRADYEVLYGIEFNASHSEAMAMLKASVFATIIQVLILVSGGMAVKLWINDKHTEKEHRIQLGIHLALFLVGFCTTIYLSLQTDQAAKAQAYQYALDTEAKAKHLKDSVHSAKQVAYSVHNEQSAKQEADIRKRYDESIAEIEASFAQQEKALRAKWASKKADKEQGYKAQRIDKLSLNNALARYGTAEAQELDKLAKQKSAKLDPVLEAKAKALEEAGRRSDEDLDALRNNVQSIEKQVHTEANTLITELNTSIQRNAEATKYRNVLLNIMGFILCMGTLFFARGANRGRRPNPLPYEDVDIEHYGSGGSSKPGPKTDGEEENEEEEEQNDGNPEPENNYLPPTPETDDNTNKKGANNDGKRVHNVDKELIITNEEDGKSNNDENKIVESIKYEALQGEGESLGVIFSENEGMPVISYRKADGEVVELNLRYIKNRVGVYQGRWQNASNTDTKTRNKVRHAFWADIQATLEAAIDEHNAKKAEIEQNEKMMLE